MDLLLTLTGGLTAALALGFVAQRLRLSPIVGYLGAGIIVGPFTPGFVAHAELANELADVGIILLMFHVGLSFHVKELLATRKVAVPGAVFGVAVATALGIVVARSFGLAMRPAIVFGLCISVASTVVLTRVLSDHHGIHSGFGRIAIGWLVVEDLLTVVALVLLPVLAGGDGDSSLPDIASHVGIAVLKLAAFIVLSLLVGGRVIPWLLQRIVKTASRELFTLSVLVMALGIAVGSSKLFGASMALGAFLAGLIVGQSDHRARVASEALPMSDVFSVLFFVSVGMLLDPLALPANLALAAATLAIVLVAKPIAVLTAMRVLRRPPPESLVVAASLAQIGEFSFVLAALGRKLGILDAQATQAIVVTAMTSITLSPILFRCARRILPDGAVAIPRPEQT
jgi:CPA2 family monovalent cation:H+ antiporter-2